MVDNDLQQTILDLLKDFQGENSLRQLCSELNYDYTNNPIHTRNWPESTLSAFAVNPVVYAGAGDNNEFHIIYTRLKNENRLLLGQERQVITQALKDHPYSMFVFSNASQDLWHFVNVKLTHEKDEDTHKQAKTRRLFRRITIGRYERLRTASERITLLDIESLSPDLFGLSPLEIQKRHDEAFDVEKVTKQFFYDYKTVFKALQDDLKRQTDDTTWAHDYALQFLNRIMFLYFVQRKRWLGDDPEFLNSYWKTYKRSQQPDDTFVDKWLFILFFEAFNRRFHGGHKHIPDNIKEILFNTPYLNGGLFKENILDTSNSFKITDRRFELIFNFFEHYNFTIAEDSPLDQEVAVDPEMIGKVYESLVNVSDDTDEQGDAGIFYTPRTEIDLMCRLALIDNLANHLGNDKKSLLYEAVFAFDLDEKAEADAQLTEQNLWPGIDRYLREITMLDPACGSGSFLVGMLKVIDDIAKRANNVLGSDELAYDRKKRIIGRSLYGVDVKQWAIEVAELRLWLQLVIDTEMKPEELTLHPLLPNLTFKIRCGDSLIQEVGSINMAHIKASADIPGNIKGKLTALKGEKLKFFNNDQSCRYSNENELRLEEKHIFQSILDELCLNTNNHIKNLRNQQRAQIGLFDDTEPKQINIFQKEIEQLEIQLEKAQTARIALRNVEDIPFVWDIAFVEIFKSDQNGFDIVIGNPPYVRQENISDPHLSRDQVTTENKKEYKEKLVQSVYNMYPDFFGFNFGTGAVDHKLDKKSDLYIYFYLHGLDLLNDKGSFCFITSNSWLDVGYGKDLQEFLLKHSHVKMILDNQVKRSFASADVNTIIALLSSPDDTNSSGLDKTARFVMFKVPFEQVLSPVIFEEIEEAAERKSCKEYRIHPLQQSDLFEDGIESVIAGKKGRVSSGPLIKVARYIGNKWGGKYLRAPDIYWTILKKGEGKLVRLGDIAEVRRGFTTGANEFFYLDEEKIREWGIEEKFLRPVIFSLKEIRCIEDELNSLKYHMFFCHNRKQDIEGTNALDYINGGESEGFHQRPTCNSRRLWYSIGENWIPAPYIFPAKVGERMVVLRNIKEILEDKKLYGVTPQVTNDIYWGSVLNSTLVRFFLDLTCRQLTGAQAIADIDVQVVEDIYILNYNNIDEALLTQCYETIKKRPIASHVRDEYTQNDRKNLDNVIFDSLKLSQTEIDSVYESVINLVEERLKKAKNI